jgi:hypothetical protein
MGTRFENLEVVDLLRNRPAKGLQKVDNASGLVRISSGSTNSPCVFMRTMTGLIFSARFQECGLLVNQFDISGGDPTA